MKCNLCPRQCNVDRFVQFGYCKTGNNAEISKVMLHYGEEPFLTKDSSPSGAIFFAGCNLKCVYCQNYAISNGNGKPVFAKTLANLYHQLENAGASNIDLVTPTHFSNVIIESLKIYKPKIPVIFNCGGYESVQTIKSLAKFVDIFLFDLKYFEDTYAIKYSKAPKYFEIASKAILEARKLKKDRFENGQMIEGIVIRHLCLPNLTKDSKAILDFVANSIGKNTYISIMSQYTPIPNCKNFPEINRPIKPIEYKAVVSHAKKLGLNNALIQDVSSCGEDMIPNFEESSPFDY